MDQGMPGEGFAEPSLISVDSDALTAIVKCALSNQNVNVVLCLFHFLKETHYDESGPTFERGPGYQLGFYEKDKVPVEAFKSVGGSRIAFRIPHSLQRRQISFSSDRNEFLIHEIS